MFFGMKFGNVDLRKNKKSSMINSSSPQPKKGAIRKVKFLILHTFQRLLELRYVP
jgi:hypothetical protein